VISSSCMRWCWSLTLVFPLFPYFGTVSCACPYTISLFTALCLIWFFIFIVSFLFLIRVLHFFNWKFPFFIPVIGNKAYILLCQLVACWQPLARRVSFSLDIHVVHPFFEAHNILIVLHSLGGDAWCVLYDVPDHVKVDIEGDIVVLLSPLVHSMP
jgi:hypothetical protein